VSNAKKVEAMNTSVVDETVGITRLWTMKRDTGFS
jgi:hypothetical protein